MKGFSLLEVLIALALASVMIVLSDYALSQTAKTNATISQNYSKLFGG